MILESFIVVQVIEYIIRRRLKILECFIVLQVLLETLRVHICSYDMFREACVKNYL